MPLLPEGQVDEAWEPSGKAILFGNIGFFFVFNPAWEFAAHAYLLKLQRIQNDVPRTIGKFPKRTPTRDLHVAFRLSDVYVVTSYVGSKRKSFELARRKNLCNTEQSEVNTQKI
jgi:hypothetical protein